MTWIVTANSNHCCIYQFDKKSTKITLLKEIDHPANKHKKSDYFTTDKPGHYKSNGSAGGSYSSHTDPKAAAIDDFSREVAHELNRGRNANAYKALIIITPSHMNGLLHKHLDKNVQELVSHTIQKDVMSLSERELLQFVEKNI